MSMSFYKYFIDNIIVPKHNNDIEHIANGFFRRYLIEKYGVSYEIIALFAKSLINRVQKPQRCLKESKNYYIAIDLYTKTKYMCYKDIMLLDVDFNKDGDFTNHDQIILFLKEKVKKHDFVAKVFKSRNGIHAFLIDKKRNFKSKEDIDLMIDCKVDFYYIIYSYIRGWSVRLSRKKDEEISDNGIYQYVDTIGNRQKICSDLENLVDLHYIFSMNEK